MMSHLLFAFLMALLADNSVNAPSSPPDVGINWQLDEDNNLVEACIHRDIDAARRAINHHADVNTLKSKYGVTPLYIAAGNDKGLVDLLLRSGADPNRATGKGRLPLLIAIASGKRDVFELLLASGAKLDAVESLGGVLHVTAMTGDSDLFESLLKRGADVKVISERGESALHYAAELSLKDEELAQRKLKIARMIVERGGSVDTRAKDGSTPLLRAARSGNCFVGEYLISKGADVNATDLKGNTPLSLAGKAGASVGPKGARSLVDLLLWSGAKK